MQNHIFMLPEVRETAESRAIKPSYADIERLKSFTDRYREMVRASIEDYREWLDELAQSREIIGRSYALYEGQYLRARICDSWLFYRIVRKELTRLQIHYKREIMMVAGA